MPESPGRVLGESWEAESLLITAQVHKVASYCLTKLLEASPPIQMEMRPQYLRRPPHAPEPKPPSGQPVLELLCNGMVSWISTPGQMLVEVLFKSQIH